MIAADVAMHIRPAIHAMHVMHAPTGSVVARHVPWTQWSATPVELVLLVSSTAWYAAGVRAMWREAGRGRVVSRAQFGAFISGSMVLAMATMSPLDAMADALFSAHMVQHLLLMLVAAPLWIAGAPLVPVLWALPRTTRRAIGRWWGRHPTMRHIGHTLTSPGVAFTAQSLALWCWHFPVPYQLALANPVVHALEHLSFFSTALLFWWAVIQPVGRRRATHGGALLLVVGTLMQSGVLGALLLFSSDPWYPAHAAGVTAWGTTLRHDQQLAGLLMWIPAGAVYLGAAAWLFAHWMHSDARLDGRRQRLPRRHPIPLLENSR